MFTRTAISASVFASLVSAGPIMMRRDSISFGGSGLSSGFSSDISSSDISSSSFNSDLFGSNVITPIWQFDNDEFDDSSISLTDFSSSLSFDHFGGLSSLNGFDSFYGADNFCGLSNTQTFIESESVTCESQEIDIVQQQLAIITEYAKRVILSSVCEVETQTIVLSQWISTLQVFSSDIRHEDSSREVTFDSHVASFISDICDSEGNPIYKDFGFDGTDIGSSCVSIEGLNWNDESSPSSVSSAFSACETAAGFSISPPTLSSISSSCGSYCSYIPSSLSSSCYGSDCSDLSSSSSCYGSDCSDVSSLPPSSSCYGSDCDVSSSSSCYGSDCDESSLPPSSSCYGSDCSDDSDDSDYSDSSCYGSDCSDDSSLPPSSSCDGSDCDDDDSCDGSDCSDDSTLSSGDIATLSSGDVSTDDGDLSTDSIDLPDSTDSAGDDTADPTDSVDADAPAATVASLTPIGAGAAAAPTAVGST